jgi:N utilization substance protein B
MLSRRVLRIKAMQALYAYFQSDNEKIEIAEKKLIKDINSVYDLYIWQLSFFCEFFDFAAEVIEILKNKHLATPEDKNPNTKFVNNLIFQNLQNNADFIKKRELYNVNWSEQKDLIRKIFNTLKDTDEYKHYLSGSEQSYIEDYEISEFIFRELIADNETLEQYYEEKNVYWADDYDIVSLMVLNTLKRIAAEKEKFEKLPGLFNDDGIGGIQDEEIKFARDLLIKTILHSDEYEELISNKAENWEADRIALMDFLLIKMALCEFVDFPSIPTKVTINEYIEISKNYSTPKSKIFINGLLDKLLFDLTALKKIKKTGRGLIG